jgi:hypothetical protein
VGTPVIEQVKIQARVLVPLVKALQAELGEERANGLVRKALGDVYRRLGEQWWQARESRHVGENMTSAFAAFSKGNAVDYTVRAQSQNTYARDGAVGLVFIDADAKAYLSITVEAAIRRDHAKAAEIWKRTDNVWWRGPDDPDVCVLRVTPITAELWDGPASKAVAIFEFAKARLTGAKPRLGENRKVTVRMRSQPGKRQRQSRQA